MRTTVEFDDDVATAIAQLRKERGAGVSEAVNELIRRGLLHRPQAQPFTQVTGSLGLRIDVTNIADALDLLEGSESR